MGAFRVPPPLPFVVRLWTWLEVVFVNQTWPLGPAVIPSGPAPPVSPNPSLTVVDSNCRDSSPSSRGRRRRPSLFADPAREDPAPRPLAIVETAPW